LLNTDKERLYAESVLASTNFGDSRCRQEITPERLPTPTTAGRFESLS